MTFMSKHVFGLIPARGGSKGLVNKNMIDLLGQPLLHYTIDAAKKSKFIDTVIVSSDSNKILEFSLSQNVVPLTRPLSISNDKSSAVDVVNHFYDYIKLKYNINDIVICYLQPTSPLRNEHHIDNAFNLLIEQKSSTLLSINKSINIPYKMFKINEKGFLESLFDEKLSNERRQDLPNTFVANGAIYIFPLKTFKIKNKFPSNSSVPYIMSCDESIDIDDLEDLQRVESLMLKRVK